jgi:hypothetical protein
MLEISEAGSAWPSTAAPDRGTARRYHLDALMELGPEFAFRELDASLAHCRGSAGALARLSAEYAMPGVVGVGLVHCSMSVEMEVMIRS